MVEHHKPTLIIDTREKVPWDFESDDAFEAIKHQKLDGGDYSIEGLEDFIIIERKASVNELFVNFTSGKKRIRAEFDRLKEVRYKIIIIEESLDDIMNPYKYYVNQKGINKQSPKMPIAVVVSHLTDLMLTDNVQVIFGGSRAQSIARGLLLRTYQLHQSGKI